MDTYEARLRALQKPGTLLTAEFAVKCREAVLGMLDDREKLGFLYISAGTFTPREKRESNYLAEVQSFTESLDPQHHGRLTTVIGTLNRAGIKVVGELREPNIDYEDLIGREAVGELTALFAIVAFRRVDKNP